MKTIVVGGNFGGLSAAVALRQAGIDATVFERVDDLTKLQAGWPGIHLWTNAMRALAVLGLDKEMETRGDPVERFEYRSWGGKLLSTWELGTFGRQQRAPTVLLRRGDVNEVLAAALLELHPDAIRLGAECTGFTQDDDGVTATFTDGREERADLLVGADGMNSVVRRQLLGEMPPRYSGNSLIRGKTTLTDGTVPPQTMLSFWGPGTRVIVNQIDHERVTWFLVATVAAGDTTIDKELLLRLTAGWADPVQRLIQQTEPELMQRFDIYDRPPVSTWGQGRVTLLGDAAHPMQNTFAQGACQALEDSVVLKLVFTEGGPIDAVAALRRYEQRRMPRTTSHVKRARTFGSLAQWKHPLAWRARDRFIAATSGVVWKKFVEDMTYAF